MQNTGKVKASDNKPPKVGYQGNWRMCLLGSESRSAEWVRCRRLTRSRIRYRIGDVLEGKMDVDESCDCLDRPALLGMIDEVTLAGLIFRVPFEARVMSS